LSTHAILIGGGVNELVAAHLLARAGWRVIVLDPHEPAERPLPDEGWIAPRIVRELALVRHGLRVELPDPWIEAPLPGGERLQLWRDVARSVESIRRQSARDAARWPAFCERMHRLAGFLEGVYMRPPPDPASRDIGETARFLGVALRARLLGRAGLDDLMRLLPMPVADLLDDEFESDALKGVLGAAGIRHLHLGPRSGGTAFALLHAHVGSPPGTFASPCSNLRQVLLAKPGVDIRRGARVAAINVKDSRVAGVTLAGGEELACGTVLSGLDPKRTLLELADPAWLDPELARSIGHVRSRGVSASIVFSVGGTPPFGVLTIAPSLDHLERAHDVAKHGSISPAPYVEARAFERDGGWHVRAHFQYAPHALAAEGWDQRARGRLRDLALAAISKHVPAFASSVTAVEVRTPADLERQEGFPQGQMHHAELALDQALWMRPVPELAQYRTPIAGLYLCGPAMHPGGAIAGAAGFNAARQALRDGKGAGDSAPRDVKARA
jgi:phytoene dehydrogenase-like protein